ncbi:MAG: response regulator transcription factor [Lachnospiraceae bacterium]|nr:response regulator transcription factor [Lachnospiraceae bacterium]
MPGASILVVDDDKEIADLVEIHLVSDGYQVYKANSAKEGMEIFEREQIDLMILDIMMPEVDGLTMCNMVREKSNLPIIMLSAKSTDLDKIVGLSNGADDYVIKPFNPLELMARVKSQLRRYTTFNVPQERQAKEIVVSNLRIDTINHKVIANEKEVKLTPIEFKIVTLLASHPGKVYSTDEIFEQVWNEKMYEANNTVMVHIRRLREKIEINPRNAKIIKTVWGVGYKIDE